MTDLGMLFSVRGTDGFKAGAVLAAGSVSWKCWPAHYPLVFYLLSALGLLFDLFKAGIMACFVVERCLILLRFWCRILQLL